jgi:hypothetical protein
MVRRGNIVGRRVTRWARRRLACRENLVITKTDGRWVDGRWRARGSRRGRRIDVVGRIDLHGG